MKFTADKDVILNLLLKASGTVSNKDVQPILKNFLIQAEDEVLSCMSTDMSLGALAEVELPTIVTEGRVCVPAKKLLDMAKSAPAGMMCLELEDKVLTVLTSYTDKNEKKEALDEPLFKNKWTLHCEDGNLYPEFPAFDDAKALKCTREPLVKGLNRISFAAADSELTVNLMAIYINDGMMYAADGHRACKLVYESDLQDIMIPHPAVKMLVSLLRNSQANDVAIVKTNFHLLFKVGQDIYHSRLLDAKFPPVEKRVFQDTNAYDQELRIKRLEIRSAIKRAQVTVSEETKSLELKYEDNKLTIGTNNSTDDTFVEELWCEWEGEDFTRTINWEYFADVIGAMTEDNVIIKLGADDATKKKRSKFRFEEGDFTAVVMPLRVKRDSKGNVERIHARVAAHADAKDVVAEMGA